MNLSFVIPIYNEEESISQLYREIEVNAKGHDFEVIFIDDGSNDNGPEIIQQLAQKDKRVKLVQFRRNFGKAAALQEGFRHVNGEIIFTMDGDLQDNPIEIPAFINKIEKGYDLVSGWKKQRHDPITKRLPSRLFNAVTSRTFNVKLHDHNCGFKAYRPEVIEDIELYGEMHRYIPALAASRGFNVGEIPIEHRKRQHGHSKYGSERLMRGFLDLLTVQLVTRFGQSPLYLFGKWGLAALSSGFAINLYLTVMKIFYGMPLSNRPLLFLGILLMMLGLQLLSIGLIAELSVNQSRNGKRKPNIKAIYNTENKSEGGTYANIGQIKKDT
ncbi:MAG: glycosyltransferase family 2 protein [Candidatus Cloacimonetes bacterium]|nr:glycosyltransferase family 2 protein [Candidatus Cloacimonadota bacterium]